MLVLYGVRCRPDWVSRRLMIGRRAFWMMIERCAGSDDSSPTNMVRSAFAHQLVYFASFVKLLFPRGLYTSEKLRMTLSMNSSRH